MNSDDIFYIKELLERKQKNKNNNIIEYQLFEYYLKGYNQIKKFINFPIIGNSIDNFGNNLLFYLYRELKPEKLEEIKKLIVEYKPNIKQKNNLGHNIKFLDCLLNNKYKDFFEEIYGKDFDSIELTEYEKEIIREKDEYKNYLITQTSIYEYQSPSFRNFMNNQNKENEEMNFYNENNNNQYLEDEIGLNNLIKIKQKVKIINSLHFNYDFGEHFGNYFSYYYGPLSKFIENIYFTGNKFKKLEAIYDANKVLYNVCNQLLESEIYSDNLIYINFGWILGKIISENNKNGKLPTIKLNIEEGMNITESINNFFNEIIKNGYDKRRNELIIRYPIKNDIENGLLFYFKQKIVYANQGGKSNSLSNYYKQYFIKKNNFYLPNVQKINQLQRYTNKLIDNYKNTNKKIILPIPSSLYYLLSLPEKSIKDKFNSNNNKMDNLLNKFRKLIEKELERKNFNKNNSFELIFKKYINLLGIKNENEFKLIYQWFNSIPNRNAFK
jgi:hypothetical protein